MNAIDLDSVCSIVLKARVLNAKEGVVGPDDASNPVDDDDRQILEDNAEDATAEELRSFINDLNVDQRVELVALAWVGRGSFSREEWPEALAEARREGAVRTADYLMGIPLLGDYLEEGLAAFGMNCSE